MTTPFLTAGKRIVILCCCSVQRAGDFLTRNVREIRNSLCLTQEELAFLVDVEPRTIQRWEAGYSLPSCRNVYKLVLLDNARLPQKSQSNNFYQWLSDTLVAQTLKKIQIVAALTSPAARHLLVVGNYRPG